MALKIDSARIAWFKENGRPPRKALDAEDERLAGILGRDLAAEIRPA